MPQLDLTARPQRTLTTAALVHGFDWCSSEQSVDIGHGVKAIKLEGTQIQTCYHALCANLGIDDSDPFGYEVAFWFEQDDLTSGLTFGEPYSDIERLCNLLTVLTSCPVSMCRVLWSFEAFQSQPRTELVHCLVGQTEFLPQDFRALTSSLLADLTVAWSTSQALFVREKARGRISNALMFFYSAWRSHYMEHICLNLAITLEILFAPHSAGEATHQIAFNMSRFLSNSPTEREQMYKTARNFFTMRAAVIHGGIPDDEKVIPVTVEMFTVVARILRQIVLDPKLAEIFNSNAHRTAMLREYLFK